MGFTNQIKVTANLLNCRLQPSMSAKIVNVIKMDEVHNVVAEQNGWGQLENGSWINLKFTVPVECKENIGTPDTSVESAPVVHEVLTPSDIIVDKVLTLTAPAEGLDVSLFRSRYKRESL